MADNEDKASKPPVRKVGKPRTTIPPKAAPKAASDKPKPKRTGMAAFLAQKKAAGAQEVVIENKEIPSPGKLMDGSKDLDVFDEAAFTDRVEIGQGKFGVVYSAKDKDGKQVALKIMRYTGKAMEIGVRREFDLVKDLSHPGIVCSKGLFADESNLVLVMELVGGVELIDLIPEIVAADKAAGEGQHPHARRIFKELLEALAYVHANNTAHLDIKPQNVIATSRALEDASVKFLDFGLSRRVDADAELTAMLGTPVYCCPQMFLKTKYGLDADMWSMGCLLCLLLTGRDAFEETNRAKLGDLVEAGNYGADREEWAAVNPDAKDLVKGLMQVDIASRLTAQQALEHAWMASA